MAARKTVKVAELVRLVNERNRVSKVSADFRHGQNLLLEKVLHETGNYRGFGYYTAKDVPDGERPGVAVADDGTTTFPDESRVFFYSK